MPHSNFERKSCCKHQTRLTFDSGTLSLNHRPSKNLNYQFPKEFSSPVPSFTQKIEQNDAEKLRQPIKTSNQPESLPFISPPATAKSSPVIYQYRDKPKEKPNEAVLDKSHDKFKPQAFLIAHGPFRNKYRMGLSHENDSSQGSEVESDDPVRDLTLENSKSMEVVDLCSESEGSLTALSISKIDKNSSSQCMSISVTPDLEGEGSFHLSQTNKDESIFLISRSVKLENRLYKTSNFIINNMRSFPNKNHAQTTNKLPTEDESEEDVRSSPLKRRQKVPVPGFNSSPLKRRRNKIASIDTDESEEVLPLSLRRRTKNKDVRQKNLKNSISPGVSSQISSPRHHTRKHRAKKHRTNQEKAFELMRRKRAGEKINKLTSSESSEKESDEDLFFLTEFEDDEEDIKVSSDCIKGKEKVEKHADDSEFVVEDIEGPLGVPDYSTHIPLQFSHAAHKRLSEHFRDAVEWMVKNEIFPDFLRNDQVYRQAFRKLSDVCDGLAKSKFVSTQWTSDFTAAITSRPYLISGELNPNESDNCRPRCDACNHRNHIPTSFIKFEGKVYNKESLVKTSQSSESGEESTGSENSNASQSSEDSRGKRIPPQSKRWFVGSTCINNATYAHSLIHWKYCLNKRVVSTLTLEGHLTSRKVEERNKMSPETRNQHANLLVDEWEARGTIRSLYQDWKSQRISAIHYKKRFSKDWN